MNLNELQLTLSCTEKQVVYSVTVLRELGTSCYQNTINCYWFSFLKLVNQSSQTTAINVQ